MASKKEVQRVISGRMNLLPPVDKIQDQDALLLRNWRMDTAGKLQVRGGAIKVFGPVGSGRYHSTMNGAGYVYHGIGTQLFYGLQADTLVSSGFDGQRIALASYRGASYAMNRGKQARLKVITGSKWGIDAPATPAVATGGGQITKTLEPWDGSSGANTVIAAAAGLTPGAPNNIAMLNDGPQINDAASYLKASFSSQPTQVGGNSLGLSFQGTASGSVTAYGNYSSAFSGVAADTDIFRFWVWVSDPSQVNSMTVSMKDNAGGYVEVPFSAAAAFGGTFFPPAKFLSQTPGAWAQIVIRRQVNLDQYAAAVATAVQGGDQQTISDAESNYAAAVTAPAFALIGKGSPQTGLPVPPSSASILPFNWLAITQISVSFNVADACQISLQRFEVVGTVTANLEGSIQYYVSFANADGQDSNPSPASNSVIAGNQSITLNSIPVSTDPQVNQRWIYRIGGGISQALRVGVIPDNNTTGPWQDPTTNEQAQNSGVYMPINRDLPPVASGVVGPFYGKLLAFATADHPARYFWTTAGHPWYFPGANDDAVGNWEDAGGDDDEIVAITIHPTLAVMYKQRSIWRLPGDPDVVDVVPTNSTRGLVGPDAVVSAGSIDYFVSHDGIYVNNLDFEQKISTDIDPLFKDDFVFLTGVVGNELELPPANQSKLRYSVLTLEGDKLRFSYASWYSDANDTVLVYHIPSKRWGLESYDELPATAFTAASYGTGDLNDSWARTSFLGFTAPGAGGGYNYHVDQNFSGDDGQLIVSEWRTPFYDQGLPDNFKWYSDLEIEVRCQMGMRPPSLLLVSLLLDNGKRQIDLATLANPIIQADRGIIHFKLPSDNATLGIPVGTDDRYGLRAKNWAIVVKGIATTGSLEVYGAYMHWWPEERQADTFDSGDTNLGMPERVKEVDYLEMYVTANGGTLQTLLSSDLPGSVLTQRAGFATINAPIGRGNVRLRMPTGVVDGRNFRFQVTNKPTGNLMQVHQARVRMRPIGEYIDGTIGEFYESPEFSVAPARLAELKDFTLDYDVSGPGGQLVIYSDLPGTAGLTVRRTIPIPYLGTGARTVYTFPLESTSDAESDDLPNGELFKVRLYPPPGGVLRLHGRAQFRARVIGVYFNGANGEIWETQPNALFGGLALIREAGVTLEAEGPMLVELIEELPNQDERTVASFTADPSPTTRGRLPIYARLPGHAKAELIKFRISGPYVCRLYELKAYGRRLQNNATSWDWAQSPGITPTTDEWANIPMPVRSTPEEFVWIELPVDVIG